MMIHNPCMLYALDRVLTSDLSLSDSHQLVKTVTINSRIRFILYQDFIFYFATFFVDDEAVIKEVMISNTDDYVQHVMEDLNLHFFLIDYADKSPV